MNSQDIYHDDELDSEWGKYVASLHENNSLITKKYRDKKRIIQRERETMINLQKHVRGLSRARFELEDAAIDSFDDNSSQSNSDINSSDSDNNSSDSDFIPPQPQPTINSLINKPLNYNNYKHKSKKSRNNKTILQPILIDPLDPYNIKSDSNDILSNYDSNDSDINDSHCINGSESNSNDSFSDNSQSNDTASPKSLKSSDKSSSTESIEQMEYDKELIKLKKELNQFKKRNFTRLRRTKSQEEVLLSVLNIDQKHIDKKQLEKCTKKAITKYNTMTLREKRRVEREQQRKKQQKLNSKTLSSPHNITNTKSKFKYKPKYKPSYSNNNSTNQRYLLTDGTLTTKTKPKTKPIKKRNKIKKRKRLFDPYNLEFNGLDPDDYMWYDDVPEGECYDDKELSLYDRRMQYLVIMAIENHYCSINDLTYQQNELLLQYQKTLKF